MSSTFFLFAHPIFRVNLGSVVPCYAIKTHFREVGLLQQPNSLQVKESKVSNFTWSTRQYLKLKMLGTLYSRYRLI